MLPHALQAAPSSSSSLTAAACSRWGTGQKGSGSAHAAAQGPRQARPLPYPAATRSRPPRLQNNLLAGAKGSNAVDPRTFTAACVRDDLVTPSGGAFYCAGSFDFEGREIASP